ncbi:CmpA/NrtA family ABC transporter substrate-binding protein [Agrobacterium rosae]|uniref:ABC transporter permease n=1 Tax=Agrobacterium rosae TaxID=1972867 RepID=A0AAE5VP41_9HYPH|nr:CmpA/NrtA family ABC transporter substrate-binding protein [Agrobacterium rosae]KAA3514167.1 ABC transporter permease [Agrobacterium rosae]KAA3523275.1 ABC transporter permease [Agrobacterium rosae]MCM2433889.1 ABC transporter substrate-binding protein [Agrobacterium rosae]MDX8330556.1 CmpA/NrtA family ABC transporter substrate-binding protein [Agrobacterium rosae]MQB47515.1 ABC transporter permease [Agrobacterium rosae]
MAASKSFKAGFSPTIDCAVLVVAAEKGFDTDEGLSLELVKKPSAGDLLVAWGAGDLHGLHLPASLPVASALGLPDMPADLVAPFVLATGGATLTVSQILHDDLAEQGMKIPDPATVARAVARVAASRQLAKLKPLVFAVEHLLAVSVFELRYLLGSAHLHTDRDVNMIAASPADMPDMLEAGDIDGFYVGEPYGSAAVLRGTARIITTKSHIWQNAPEKVLALSRDWASAQPATLEALLRALYRAGEWCSSHANIEELAGILAAPHYLDVDGDFILPALTGYVSHSPARMLECPGFFSTSSKAANFPWQSQALWFFSQMLRWEDCPPEFAEDAKAYEAACQAFRPDLFRKAMKPIFAPVPAANMKLEGTLQVPVHVGASRSDLILGPDAFFDGRIFDPEKLGAGSES